MISVLNWVENTPRKGENAGNQHFFLSPDVSTGFYRSENIVRKGENVGNQHFLLFCQCFQKVLTPAL